MFFCLNSQVSLDLFAHWLLVFLKVGKYGNILKMALAKECKSCSDATRALIFPYVFSMLCFLLFVFIQVVNAVIQLVLCFLLCVQFE